MARRSRWILTTLALSFLATPALGQACIGTPLSLEQLMVGIGVSFPEGAKGFGINLGRKMSDHLVLGAEFTILDTGGIFDPGNYGRTMGASMGFEAPIQPTATGLEITVCPTINPAYEVWGDYNRLVVPFGLGTGITFPLAGGAMKLTPWVIPQVVRIRESVPTFSVTDSGIAVTGGANLIVKDYFGGLRFSKESDVRVLFRIQAGMIF
ncbi:MAG: hypothetical protein LBG44_02720 [Gemmatimonadota bacterium]|jgi:hypothetical protein|nr:hypothetical protein [Gemmatimonadota bacterium]